MSVSRLALKLSVGIYSCLLVIYPVGFRREFGEQMVMVFEDMCWDAMRFGGVWGLVGVWYLVLSELWGTAREQHLYCERVKIELCHAEERSILRIFVCSKSLVLSRF